MMTVTSVMPIVSADAPANPVFHATAKRWRWRRSRRDGTRRFPGVRAGARGSLNRAGATLESAVIRRPAVRIEKALLGVGALRRKLDDPRERGAKGGAIVGLGQSAGVILVEEPHLLAVRVVVHRAPAHQHRLVDDGAEARDHHRAVGDLLVNHLGARAPHRKSLE